MVRHRHTEHIQLALLPVVGQKGMESFPPYRGMACDADLVLVDNAADNCIFDRSKRLL